MLLNNWCLLALLAPCRVLFPQISGCSKTFKHRWQANVAAVLQVPTEYAVGTLRLSTGRHTVRQDIVKAVDLITKCARQQGVPLL